MKRILGRGAVVLAALLAGFLLSIPVVNDLTANWMEDGPRFDAQADGEGCYIVYSWGDGAALFEEFDLRGH